MAAVFANFGSFWFHAIVSRRIGVAAYGSLYALVSLVQLASLPAGIFTTVIAKFAAEFRALDDPAELRALSLAVAKIFGVGLFIYAIAGAVAAVPVAEFLHVPTWAIVVASVAAGATVFAYALRALPQGTQDFKDYSAALLTEGGVKASLGVAIATAKFGLVGGILGFLSGSIISGMYVAWRLWRKYSVSARLPFRVDWKRVYSTTAGAVSLTAATTLLSYADVILVKHFFDARDAGIYAAASLGGKILFFLIAFAPAVLIPKAADLYNRGENATGVLTGALLMVALLSTAGLLFFGVYGSVVLHLLVGVHFEAAAAILPWYGLAMAILGVTNVVASYSIALHRFEFGFPLIVIAAAEIAAMYFFHPNLQIVVFTLVAGNALALATVCCALFIRRRPSANGRAPDPQRPIPL